jgi:hypothetical protein
MPMLPEIEKVFASFTYINPISALEYMLMYPDFKKRLLGFVLSTSAERKA